MVGMFSPTTGSNKRRQLAPPSLDSLPRTPLALGDYDCQEREGVANKHRDSLILQYLKQATAFTSTTTSKDSRKVLYDKEDMDFNDDDTASTVSMSTSSDSDSLDEVVTTASGNKKSVRFASTLVSTVHTRPRTTAEDKYYLHYNEHEYMDFKIAYVTGKDRTRKVGFAREVVSEMEYIPLATPATKASLYYSEDELQWYVSQKTLLGIQNNDISHYFFLSTAF